MTNPLMTAPRERVVYLHSGDVEQRLADLKERIESLAGDPAPRRAGMKSPAMQAAEEYDAEVAKARESAIRVVVREVSQRAVDQIRDDHPPREGNERDKMLGYNADTYPWALVREAIVDPVVTEAQWDEFVASASPARRNLLVKTVDDLSMQDVSLPKSSAVSALRRMLGSDSKQLDEAE